MHHLQNRSRGALLGALLLTSSCIFSQEAAPGSSPDMSAQDMRTSLDQSGGPDLDLPDLDQPDLAPAVDMPVPSDMNAADMDAPDAACPREDDDALCARGGYACGDAEVEACGEARTVRCGECPMDGDVCTLNKCGPCEPETDEALCGQRTCGGLTVTDRCGMERKVDCGQCLNGATCDRSGTCVRSCRPEDDTAFCARNGAACGAITALDNCNTSRSVHCGTCGSTGGRCLDNQCSGAPCVSEDDSAFCARVLQSGCGMATGIDNCGVPRCVANCNPCLAAVECCTNNVCQLMVNDVCAVTICPATTP
jgi:hypothetical protein